MRYSLKQALLLSTQSKASLLIEVHGNRVDYKLVAFSPDIEGVLNILEIYTVKEGKVATESHRGMAFPEIDKLIAFVSECGFVVDCAWTAEEPEEAEQL
jgi:hypothetical protein